MTTRAKELVTSIVLATSIVTVASFDMFLWRRIVHIRIAKPAEQAVVALAVPAAAAATIPEPVAIASVGVPVRMSIRSIALDAAVENVALTEDGAMSVPSQPSNAAWYSLGPRPGQVGSATIDGHVNWYRGEAAVFENLHKVAVGDSIDVTDESGKTISFVVVRTHRYDRAADATDVFTSDDGKAHLNVITCDGKWDASTQQFLSRLVVFADRIGD